MFREVLAAALVRLYVQSRVRPTLDATEDAKIIRDDKEFQKGLAEMLDIAVTNRYDDTWWFNADDIIEDMLKLPIRR